jgi:hypothetical protein
MFRPQVVFLAAHLVDRYVSTVGVCPRHYWGLVDTLLILSLKYDGATRMTGDEKGFWISWYSTKSCYSKRQRQVEVYALQVLRYDLSWPGPLPFLYRLGRAMKATDRVYAHALKVLQEGLACTEFIYVRPSLLAAASFFIATTLLGSPRAQVRPTD